MRETPDPVSPTTAAEVAAALRRAAEARQTMAIRGAGTKSGWGRDARGADMILDTSTAT